MKRIFYFIAILAALEGCKRSEIEGGANGEPTVRFTAAFVTSHSSPVTSTKATSTAFEDGDRVGVYITKRDLPLRGSFNAMDNRLFEYFEAGDSLGGVPNAVFYPDKTTPVAVYAYYPFAPNINNALALPFNVTANLKASDLCYAKLPTAVPSSTPQPLQFVHSLSKLTVNVDFSSNDNVESVTLITLLNIIDSCYLNLNTGIITNGAHVSDIEGNVFILPAQTLHAGKLFRVTCKMKTGRTEEFYFEPLSSPLTLQQSKKHEITLILAASGSVALSDNQPIADWTEAVQKDDMDKEEVDNHFTLHWLLPHMDYSRIGAVELHIRNSRSGYLSPHATTALVAREGNSKLKASYTFDLKEPRDLNYPYTIEAVEFKYAAGATIQLCKTIVAATVYRAGDITLGLRQENLLMITTGTIKDWNGEDIYGDIDGGGVSNILTLTLIEQPAYASVKSIALTIDDVVYTIPGIGFTSSSNRLIATTNPITFKEPGVDGYPYSITKIELKNASSGAVATMNCYIELARQGAVDIEFTENDESVIWATANLGAANPQDYGNLYKWGDTWAYDRTSSASDGMAGTDVGNASTSPAATGTGNLGYDYGLALSGGRASGDPCKSLGPNWKTPTRAQFQELFVSGKSAWTTYQGINGYFFGPNAASCNNTTIKAGCVFFPAAGYRDHTNGALLHEGDNGHYWCSSVYSSTEGHNFYLTTSNIYPVYNNFRGYGFSVRCIQD